LNQTLLLGALITLFATLLWRKLDGIDKRLDGIDKTMEKISDRLSNHVGDFREFKGKVEALLGTGKKQPEPAIAEKAS
jgi:hypothetical protein